MDQRLLLMNTGYGLGIILMIILIIFVWIKSKRDNLAILFCLFSTSIAIVEVSIIGLINANNLAQAYEISFLNIANIYIVVFLTHWVLETIDKSKSRKVPLAIIYGIALLMTVFFIFEPQSFLLQPVPKMYFNYYFVPGSLYGWMRIYFTIVTIYFLSELYIAYRSTVDIIIRNRYKYALAGIIWGMVFGHYALFLVYNIQIDPIWSLFFPFCAIPFAYSIIRYELMDIKIVAKRAMVYGLTVSFFAIILNLINLSNEILLSYFTQIPGWLVPLGTSFFASSLGFIIWFRLKDSELLRYEFITIVTHKFRTPITRIKWAINSLKKDSEKSKEIRDGLEIISLANESLLALTNTLVQATDSERIKILYSLSKEDIPILVEKVVEKFKKDTDEKGIKVSFNNDEHIPSISINSSSFTIVMNSIVENAINYNKYQGEINIKIKYLNRQIEIIVEDSGIGIKHQDLSRIFSKFYRSDSSMHVDTEGLGINLFIAKQIADRNGWDLKAYSPGENKGSIFTLYLPAKV